MTIEVPPVLSPTVDTIASDERKNLHPLSVVAGTGADFMIFQFGNE